MPWGLARLPARNSLEPDGEFVMTKSAHRLLKTRIIGSLGAVTLLALATLLACGNDDIPSEGGAGASNAHAGASHGGGAGKPATGDSGDTGDSGSAGEGGSAGTGDSSGADAAHGGNVGSAGGATTTAGTAGTAGNPGGALCGNNVLDPGEQCDDGNTKFGDSCSPTCTNTCEKCEHDLCGTNDDLSSDYDHCYGNGFNGALATDGPAAGTAKSKLCQAVVECVKRTQCNASDPFNPIPKPCYCGTANTDDCATTPNGVCSEAIAAAAESREFNKLVARVKSPQYALGVAFHLLTYCDTNVCGPECFQNKPKTECQTCGAQSDGFTVCEAGTCYFDPIFAPLCAPAADCALSTGCAAVDIKNCYTGAAPCLTEFAAAAKVNTVSGIDALLVNATGNNPLVIASTLLTCDRSVCQGACFPAANGGGGSGGAGGASGGVGGASGGAGGASDGAGGASAGSGP